MNIFKFFNMKKIFSLFALLALAFNQVMAQDTAVKLLSFTFLIAMCIYRNCRQNSSSL
jgi:hypothetical protein